MVLSFFKIGDLTLQTISVHEMEEKLKRTWNLKPHNFAHGKDPLGKGDIPLCEARNREELAGHYEGR